MTETIGDFQLLEKIGTGPLGELYRARDLDLGRTVTVCLLGPAFTADAEMSRSILNDARRVSALSHPAIAALYACGEDAGRAFIASEFVPGQRLSAVVAGSALNRRRALDLAVQIADGLAAAHGLELTHDALTADAVMVTPKGAAKILDVGMFDWTSMKEQQRRDDRVGLGAVLFEMLVGRPLKVGWPAELRVAGVPIDVQPILRNLTSSRAGEKYESMATAAAALRELATRLR